MKLNREQIIKALDLHSQAEKPCLRECPYGNLHYCGAEMAKDALALIRELTERAELWVAISKNYQRELDELVEANKELQTKLMVSTGEIERLTEENEKIGNENFVLICELSRLKENTVREMRSRLYEEFLKVAHIQLANEPNMRSQEVFAILDQIAKEMLEKTK